MIDVKSIGIFNEAFRSLRETSKYNPNGNDSYMTNSDLKVVNFDLVKDKYIENLSLPKAAKSSDAFYFNNLGEMYLIEFKSGRMDNKERRSIRLKVLESLLMLTDILKTGISYTRHNLSFILVYNETKNPIGKVDEENDLQDSPSKVYIKKYFLEKPKKKFIRFGLSKFEKLYFKDVYTVSEDEFENKFVKNWSKSAS